jgi:hypothetical protein
VLLILALPVLGAIGRWHFLTSDAGGESKDVSPEYKCLEWYSQEVKSASAVQEQLKNMPPCPSWLYQARLDPKFRVDSRTLCAAMTFPAAGTTFTQVC